jgi:tRNA (guanine37-N1)-methyltransferase
LSARGGSAFGGKAEEISIGPYVTTDGDVAAMVIVSAVARLLPGVIRLESLAEESHWSQHLKEERRGAITPLRAYGLRLTHASLRYAGRAAYGSLEYPHYTRPEVIIWNRKKYRVPKELLSGDHKKIEEWRKLHRRKSVV